jgi:hypothetical protein
LFVEKCPSFGRVAADNRHKSGFRHIRQSAGMKTSDHAGANQGKSHGFARSGIVLGHRALIPLG